MDIRVLTIAVMLTQAFAFMSCPSFIEVDGVEVNIPLTAHDSFATPDCKSLGLLASSDLKCDDGNWIVYNPEADEKYSLANSPFSICIDGALFGMEEESAGNVDHLRKFWETVKSSFSEADNCPTEALECYTFDVFGERYERDGGVLDESFIDLIPLDTSSELEYLATVGQNVREFVFYNGLIGRVIELDSGETYTTLNADDVEDFQLFIHPVTLEGGNWKYVIYREDTTEEVETGEADNHGERRKLTRQDALDVDFLQERLLQAPEHQRRMLQSTDVITITFVYDETIQSFSDARAAAADMVINFNRALGSDFNYQIVLKAVARATDGSLNPGSQTASCGFISELNNACRDEHNKLPTSERGDIFHCFAANGAFKDPTIGCAGEGGAGVTEIGHSFSTAIAVHEIGHQLAADHDKSHCWCAIRDFGWDWGCWCHKWKGCKIEWCTTMNPGIRSSTGHVIRMQFSNDNKREALTYASMANRQHDAITWTHCGNENEVCRCDGTVRYGANGRWASPRPVHGQISCSNSVFGDPYPGVGKRCECTTPEKWENIGKGNCLRAPGTSAYVTGYSWIGVTTNDADPRWSASMSIYNRCREVCANDPHCTGYQQSGSQQLRGGSGNCVIFNVPITGAQDLGDWWLYTNCYRRVPGW